MYDKHIQVQTGILMHRKVGRLDLGTNMERVLEVLIEVGIKKKKTTDELLIPVLKGIEQKFWDIPSPLQAPSTKARTMS